MKQFSKKDSTMLVIAMILLVAISFINWTFWSWIALGGFVVFVVGLMLKNNTSLS